jgi:hypothetical protein
MLLADVGDEPQDPHSLRESFQFFGGWMLAYLHSRPESVLGVVTFDSPLAVRVFEGFVIRPS